MSEFSGIEFVDVVALKPLADHRLWLRFSNGREGVRDLNDLIAKGGEMVEPLRDQVFFERVFLDDDVPAWPNGFDLDATNLHLEMDKAGLLTSSVAAE
jgi:hypothetical protein